MKSFYTISFLFFSLFNVSGDDLADYGIDTISVAINEQNQIVYPHTLVSGQTIYSLSKFYKTDTDKILAVNKLEDLSSIPIGSVINIPIDRDHIVTSIDQHHNDWIAIKYTVQKRETLFKISRHYFPQKIEFLVARNNIEGFALKEGQQLVVGYWNPTNTEYALIEKKSEKRPSFYFKRIPTSDGIKFQKVILTPTEETANNSLANMRIDSSYINSNHSLSLKHEKGIAIWEKSWTDDGRLYVLHKSAREQTMITLTNPIVGIEVQAEVIGNIPEGIYSEDVDIILNPAVAKKLGALDSRLRIEMDYYE